jgi:transposase-like protein
MDREELKGYLESGLSLDDIASRVSRSPSTVSYWLKNHGLVANGSAKFGPKARPHREVLASLVADGSSVPDIARMLGCTPSITRRWLRAYDLQTRQERNRALATAACAEGKRHVELVCRHHGPAIHVVEGRGSYRCTRCRAARVADYRRKLKRRLIAEAGGACILCGYHRCDAGLQFHHLDPQAKSFHLSLRGITRSMDRLRAEARKCVLLCATCHAEVEAGVASVPIVTVTR